MPVGDKLFILLLLNLVALGYLLIKIIGRGNRISKALRLTWDLIIGEAKSNTEMISSSIIWAPVLRKTWWLAVVLYGTYWLITPDSHTTIILAGLVLIHIGWYAGILFTMKEKYDRTLFLNSNWGIIYKEIADGSCLVQKSLAELDLRKKNLLVLAIERNGQVTSFPKGLEIIMVGDRVVMFGDVSAYHSVFG